MRHRFLAWLLALVGCGSGAHAQLSPDLSPPSQVDDMAQPAADLVQAATDGASAIVDASTAPVDASSPVDAAHAPADLTPACGGPGEPCCGASGCGAGPYCATATCNTGSACWVISGAPTCEPCGNVGEWCCGATCHATNTCSTSASATPYHCN